MPSNTCIHHHVTKVHLFRNLAHKVHVSDRAEVYKGFKHAYRSASHKEGQEALDAFVAK